MLLQWDHATASPAPSTLAKVETPSFYVSPTGSDHNPGTFERPFATLERAREAVRQINRSMRSDIRVYLRGGRYQLEKTFSLNAGDSGENGFNVIYERYQNEVPVLSGGRFLAGWVSDGPRWKAYIGTHLQIRQLYVNGERARRTKSTVGLTKAAVTATGYNIPNFRMAGWQNITDVEIVSAREWRLYRCHVQSVDSKSVTMQQPCWGLSRSNPSAPIGAPTWIENAFELLNAPGEWYLNRSTGWIYYQPLPGEDLTSARVVIPTLESLVTVSGTPAATVHNLIFRGITITDATWADSNGPAGFSEIQANVFSTGDPSKRINRLLPASVTVQFAQAITFERDEFKRLGGAGLAVNHVRNVAIAKCNFHDISGNGVEIGGFDQPQNADPKFITEDVQFYDNVVSDVAVEYQGGVGVWLGYVRHAVVRNNDIGRLPYSAISIGWGWGTQDPTIAGNNLIKANYIHDYMRVLKDGGGIYSLSAQPGNIYTENVIDKGAHANGAIYLDDGSRYVTVSHNVAFENRRTALIKGRDNVIFDNWWQDRYQRDVWFPDQKLCVLPSCKLNRVFGNHILDGLTGAPAKILREAGPSQE